MQGAADGFVRDSDAGLLGQIGREQASGTVGAVDADCVRIEVDDPEQLAGPSRREGGRATWGVAAWHGIQPATAEAIEQAGHGIVTAEHNRRNFGDRAALMGQQDHLIA